MMHGANPATFFILPMLGYHPNNYPRFRDCFINRVRFTYDKQTGFPIVEIIDKSKDKDIICILTRLGGGNRLQYSGEIKRLQQMPGYIEDYDDKFDPTYAMFVYQVPEKFLTDYHHVIEGELSKTSQEYRDLIYGTFPDLKENIDILFRQSEYADKK